MPDHYNNPYRHLPTLAEQKRELLSEKFAEKSVQMDPNPPPVTGTELRASLAQSDPDLLNVAGSSLVQSGGILADFGREMSNRVFGTEFDASQETGFSNRALADEIAGVSPEQRREGERLYENVYQSAADVLDQGDLEDYGGLAGSALRAGPYFAADSAATLTEYVAGAVGTAALGTGAPILGRRLLKTGQAIDQAAERVDEIRDARTKAKALKEANEAGKAFRAMKNLPKSTAKAASQASILAADLTQRGIHEYEQEHGESPSGERVAAIALTNMATTIVEPAIISNLFIGSFKRQFIKEGRSLMKHAKEPAAVKNIINRVARASGDIFKAGAAEAGQEYVQTWGEIISVGMTPEETDNLMQNLVKFIDNPEHQREALTGGAIGLGAGASVKGAIETPKVAAGTALDTTVGTAKTAAKTAGKVAKGAANVASSVQNRVDLSVISDEERQTLKNEYDVRKEVVDQKVAERQERIDRVAEVNAEEILADEDLSPIAKSAMSDLDMTEADLSKPKNLKKLKAKLTRTLKAQQAELKLELEGSTLAKQAKAVSRGLKNKAVDTAKAAIEPIKEDVVKATIAAKVKAQNAVDESIRLVGELSSSTAYGIVEAAINGTTKQTQNALTAAGDLSISDIERVSQIIANHDPKLGRKFEALVDKKTQALNRAGLRNENVTNEENIDPALKNLVDEGTLAEKNGPAVAQVLAKTLDGVIADQAALDTVKQALDIYEKSEAFTNPDTKGKLTPHTLGVYKKRLENAQKRINRKPRNVVDKVAETITEGGKRIFEGLSDAAFEVEAKSRVKAAEEVGSEEVAKVQEEIKAERTRRKQERAQKKADKEEAPGKTFTETVAEKAGSVKDTVVDAVKAGKEAARTKKVLRESDKGLYPKLKQTSDTLQQQEVDTASFAPAIPSMVKQLRQAGYESEQDLQDLVAQFPGLKTNEEIYELLKAEFESTAVLDEDIDTDLKDVPIKTLAKDAYDSVKKKLFRCN